MGMREALCDSECAYSPAHQTGQNREPSRWRLFESGTRELLTP